MGENFWENTCRLCIEKKSQLIDMDGSEELQKYINDLLQEFFQITINASEDLPKELCITCFEKMTIFWEFRQQVLENQSTLVQHSFPETIDVFVEEGSQELEYSVAEIDEKVEYIEEEREEEIVEQAEDHLEEVSLEEEVCGNVKEEMKEEQEEEENSSDKIPSDLIIDSKSDDVEKDDETPQIKPKSEEIEVLDEYLSRKKTSNYPQFFRPQKPPRLPSENTRKKDAVILKYYPEFDEIKCPSKTMDPREKDELIAEFVKLECLLCEHKPSFPDFDMLQLHHHRENHPDKGFVVCCDKQFIKKNDLIAHVINHSHPDAFKCPVPGCKKRSKSKNHLRSHMYVHLPESERPMECEQCGKRYLSLTQLKVHMNSHMPPGQKYIDKNTRVVVLGSASGLPKGSSQDSDDDVYILEDKNWRQKSDNLIMKHFPQFEQIHSATAGMSMEEKDSLIRKYVELVCNECTKKPRFIDFESLAQHYYDHHEGIRGSAVCCNKVFYQRTSLLNHVALHERPNAFACFVCTKQMRSKEMLKNHLYRHLPRTVRPLKCELCEKQFYTKAFLKDHMVTHQSQDEWQYECDECGRKFAQKGLLKRHKKIHAREVDHICEYCNKAFIGKTNYDNHKMRHHEPVKPVTCTVCGGQYKNHASLRAHMTLHTDTREHICSTCEKTYTTKSGLQAHIRYVHSGLQQFKCSQCSKKMRTRGELKEHMAKHQGNVTYQCPFCPKFFHTRSYFFSHRKKAHPQEYAMLKQRPKYPESREEN